MSNSPYSDLEASSFWKSGVTNVHPLAPADLYKKAFEIDALDKISTAGSCFAQHISRALRSVGFQVQNNEPTPRGMPADREKKFGYGLYSARYSNIYTPRQLLQILQEAFEGKQSPDPVWEKNGRFYDSMRPAVEPEGLATEQDVLDHRVEHLKSVRQLIKDTDVFIFTLGLTECWQLVNTNWIFPTAPGTIAGTFDSEKYEFCNLSFSDVHQDMKEAISIVSKHSESDNLRFLFTVSPVPLTATCSTEHVLLATTYSKSVLRAVVGELSKENPNLGYFPSFEMVTSPWSRGAFYDSNLRTVNQAGVDIIMKSFLSHHAIHTKNTTNSPQRLALKAKNEDIYSGEEELFCEEAMLEAFAKAS